MLPLEIFLSQTFLPSSISVFFPLLSDICVLFISIAGAKLSESVGRKMARGLQTQGGLFQKLGKSPGEHCRRACSSQELQKCPSQEGIRSLPSKLLRRKAGKCHLPRLRSRCISGHEIWAQPFGNVSLERLEAGGKWEKRVWGQIFPSCFAQGFATKAACRGGVGRGGGGFVMSCV